jgi:hypothetical protein
MARPGITREEVFATATALAEEGIQPTVKLVRDRIGGSFSTITPHLAAWKDERGGKLVASVPDMPEGVASVCRTLWVTAWRAGQDAIQTERDGLASARRDMEQERAELTREITDLETKLDAVETERSTLAQKATEAEQARTIALDEVSKLRVENARLEERVANTERRAEELRAQVERLERELARLAEMKRVTTEEPAGNDTAPPQA